MQIRAARVFVQDLAAARRFYADRLGLPLKADGPAQGYCVFDAGGIDFVVECVSPDHPEEDRALIGRFTGLSFAVPDLAKAHRALSSAGVQFSGLPEQQVWGGSLATFLDSEGNALQLVQYPA